MSNKSRFRGLRSAKFDWALFDSQPRAVKEICWYANASVHYSKYISERDAPATVYQFNSAEMQELARRNTELAYGKDHPQAVRRQAFNMEDLGL
jgi:hypothetical protein